jgi:hypothetical protein
MLMLPFFEMLSAASVALVMVILLSYRPHPIHACFSMFVICIPMAGPENFLANAGIWTLAAAFLMWTDSEHNCSMHGFHWRKQCPGCVVIDRQPPVEELVVTPE